MKAIILLHGLFMNRLIMNKLGKFLSEMGYKVYHFEYQSLTYQKDIVLPALNKLVSSIPESELYFIGHSMGGLVARLYLSEYKIQKEDCALITIATPHKGSHLAKYLSGTKLKPILGSAGAVGIIAEIEPWSRPVELGCIAGSTDFGFNSFFERFHSKQGVSDGTVFLEEAILDSATASVVLPYSHTGIILMQETAEQCDYFIKNRKFNE